MAEIEKEASIWPEDTFTVINDRTKEVIATNAANIRIQGQAEPRDKEEHHRMYTEPLKRFLAAELDGADLKVFLHMVAFAEYHNVVTSTPRKIREDCKLHPSTVSNSIKKLKAFGLLYTRVNQGGGKELIVDPSFVWKGANKKRKKEISRRDSERHQETCESFQSTPAILIRKTIVQ